VGHVAGRLVDLVRGYNDGQLQQVDPPRGGFLLTS
jgi:hypothetical protein